jgi:hypothetical protein
LSKKKKREFLNRLAENPYCTDDFAKGLRIAPVREALGKRYIQLAQSYKGYLSFDLDREDRALAYEEAGLPEPTVTIIDPC